MPRYDKWRWRISPEKHRKILECLRNGIGILRTAKIVGVSVRAVQRRAEFLRETATLEEVQFSKSVTTCPVHGPISTSPCVTCLALAASDDDHLADNLDGDLDDGADVMGERSARGV